MDITKIEKVAIDHIVSIPIALFAVLFGTLWIALGALVPDDIKNQALLRLTGALLGSVLLLCLLLVAYVIILKRRLSEKSDFSKFVHDPNKQCWLHKKTGQRICEACKTECKLTPLSRFGSGWKCPIHPDTLVDYRKNNGLLDYKNERIPTIRKP